MNEHEPRGIQRELQRALHLLRSADGRAVSYLELRQAGIEYPAQVIYHLQPCGHNIEPLRDATGRLRGVRLT